MAKVANFVATDTRYLSHADAAALSVGDIYWDMVVWVNLTNLPGAGLNAGIVAKWAGSNEYLLRVTNGPPAYFQFFARKADNSGSVNVATSAPVPVVGRWYMLHVYHDPTANVIGISINCGTPVTVAIPAGVRDNTNDFQVGTQAANYLNGKVGPLAIWKPNATNLTDAQLMWLYRGGYGHAFAELDAVMLAGLQCWWQMTEPTGTRVDSLAAADLSESGAISSVESLLHIPTTLLGV